MTWKHKLRLVIGNEPQLLLVIIWLVSFRRLNCSYWSFYLVAWPSYWLKLFKLHILYHDKPKWRTLFMKEIGATSAHSSCCLNKEKLRHGFPRGILKVHLFLWRWELFHYNMQIVQDFGGDVGSRNICPPSLPISVSDMENVQHREAHIYKN